MICESIISIYVSHNSEKYIKKFGHRHKKELGDKVYLVNSSSSNINVNDFPEFEVINVGDNVGFSAANNIAINISKGKGVNFYMFVNPDIYFPASWLQSVKKYLNDSAYCDVGIFTVPLLSYNFEADKATGKIDSLGVYNTWFGKWYDYLAGQSTDLFDREALPHEVPAACGALMIVSSDVVAELQEQDGFVFNESYFMYKEDIELSVRVRRLGKKIMMLPSAPAYHCRGWDGNRNSPYWKRLLSAKNELSMHLNYFWRFVPYSFIKYIYVRFFEMK